MQAPTGSFGHFRKLLETKRCIHKVSKNNARRFRFVTEKQSCGLIQECFGKNRISLDPSHYGFLETTSERHVAMSPCQLPFAFLCLIGRGLRGLAGFVFHVQCDGAIYVRLLPAFRTTTKQNNKRVAVLSKVDPITRSPVDDVFTDT